MLAIQGIYDGKQVRILPSEKLPTVTHDMAVAIIFFEDMSSDKYLRAEAARRMRKLREKMPPLGISIKELIETGRER